MRPGQQRPGNPGAIQGNWLNWLCFNEAGATTPGNAGRF